MTLDEFAGHYLVKTWEAMLARCDNSDRTEEYPNYGGRGIKVCLRWYIRRNFILDVISGIGERPEGKTLDRINNDGDYEPGNIRWSTKSEQQLNRRRGICRKCGRPFRDGGFHTHEFRGPWICLTVLT